jgi:hypothetical protein
MDSIAAPTPAEQENPPNPAGNGPERTYEFVPEDPFLVVWAKVRCGGGHSRSVIVAEVVEPDGPNPALRVRAPLGVGAVEQICRLVRERKHLEPGPHEVGG